MAKLFDSLPRSWDGMDGGVGHIRDHLEAAKRAGRYWQSVYPNDDTEAAAMTALYSAASTYRPGPNTFYSWFNTKLRGQLTMLRRARDRRKLRQRSFEASEFDSRFFYTDNFGQFE